MATSNSKVVKAYIRDTNKSDNITILQIYKSLQVVEMLVDNISLVSLQCLCSNECHQASCTIWKENIHCLWIFWENYWGIKKYTFCSITCLKSYSYDNVRPAERGTNKRCSVCRKDIFKTKTTYKCSLWQVYIFQVQMTTVVMTGIIYL